MSPHRTAALLALGWDPAWAGPEDLPPTTRPARVLRCDRGRWLVHDGCEPRAVELVGRWQQEPPVVGDWVLLDEDPPRIHRLLPRRSLLERKAPGKGLRAQVLAANLDRALLVCGLDRDQGVRSLERLVAICLEGGVPPLVLLNKADLCADPEQALARAGAAAPGVPVVLASAATGEGLEALAPWLEPRQTLCLLGPSGVGKSTLVNSLLGHGVAATGAVREVDRRGRHTTTARQLHPLPGGALLVDTPGLRELGLWCEEPGGELGFSDIAALARGCRYRDCQHDGEPGCAVTEALATGALAPDRFLRYLELRQEEQALQQRRAQHNSKRHARDIALFRRRLGDRRRDR